MASGIIHAQLNHVDFIQKILHYHSVSSAIFGVIKSILINSFCKYNSLNIFYGCPRKNHSHQTWQQQKNCHTSHNSVYQFSNKIHKLIKKIAYLANFVFATINYIVVFWIFQNRYTQCFEMIKNNDIRKQIKLLSHFCVEIPLSDVD